MKYGDILKTIKELLEKSSILTNNNLNVRCIIDIDNTIAETPLPVIVVGLKEVENKDSYSFISNYINDVYELTISYLYDFKEQHISFDQLNLPEEIRDYLLWQDLDFSIQYKGIKKDRLEGFEYGDPDHKGKVHFDCMNIHFTLSNMNLSERRYDEDGNEIKREVTIEKIEKLTDTIN